MCALRRDLESLSVTDASWAVEQGRVVEEPGGKVLRWRPSEMVAPITRVLKTYMKSDPYEAAVAEAREATHYRLLERRQKKR